MTMTVVTVLVTVVVTVRDAWPRFAVAAAARGEAELRHGLQTSWFPVRAHNFQSDLKTREFAESVF